MRAAITFVIIQAPFPDVAGHVLDPERARAERERAHRRTFRMTVIDFAVAPGENGVAVGEVSEIAAAVNARSVDRLCSFRSS